MENSNSKSLICLLIFLFFQSSISQFEDDFPINPNENELDEPDIGVHKLSGVIGLNKHQDANRHILKHNYKNGGCQWFGHSPICQPKNYCDPGFEYVTLSGGWLDRVYIYDITKGGHLMAKYGKQCTFFTQKRLCCKRNTADCYWAGVWESTGASVRISKLRKSYETFPSGYFKCTFENNSHHLHECGTLVCENAHLGKEKTYITGYNCDKVTIFGMKGEATCGNIYFSIELNGEITYVNWFKVE